MERESIITIINRKANHFYQGKWSVIIFSGLMIMFGILQTLLFVFGVMQISGFWVTDHNAWIAWVYLAVSIPSTILGIVGFVYSIKIDKRFFWPSVINNTLTIPISLIGGMMWTAITYVFLTVDLVIRIILMNKRGTDYEIDKRWDYLFGVLPVLFLIIGILTIEVDALSPLWWNDKTTSEDWMKYVDVIGGVLTLWGSLFLISKNKLSLIIYVLSDSMYLILYIIAVQPLMFVLSFIYLSSTLIGLAAWLHHDDE